MNGKSGFLVNTSIMLLVSCFVISIALIGCAYKKASDAWMEIKTFDIVLREAKLQFEAEEKHLPEMVDRIMENLADTREENWGVTSSGCKIGSFEFRRFSAELTDSQYKSMTFVKYNGEIVLEKALDHSGGIYIEEYIPGEWERELEELSEEAERIGKTRKEVPKSAFRYESIQEQMLTVLFLNKAKKIAENGKDYSQALASATKHTEIAGFDITEEEAEVKETKRIFWLEDILVWD